MTSCAMHYDVIYRPFPINSQYLKTWGVDSPALATCVFLNTPIQEKTGSCMEARPKGPSAFAAPGGKNKWLSKKVSRLSK